MPGGQYRNAGVRLTVNARDFQGGTTVQNTIFENRRPVPVTNAIMVVFAAHGYASVEGAVFDYKRIRFLPAGQTAYETQTLTAQPRTPADPNTRFENVVTLVRFSSQTTASSTNLEEAPADYYIKVP